MYGSRAIGPALLDEVARVLLRAMRCPGCGERKLRVLVRRLRAPRLVDGRPGPFARTVYAAYCPSCRVEYGDHDTPAGALLELREDD